ncbi:MAG TPA: class I SAM-dependent methyltransferase [Bryobacteraceae bacterium]|jgi:SAM-dependent methyltransferase
MQWFEDEEFWRIFYPWMFAAERRFQAAPLEVEQLLALSGVSGGAALDLCCGPARHSLLLAEKGFRVTGVDRTPFLLAKAKERAASAGASIEFVQCDARDFLRPGAFDLAVNLFTSFGYFETREEDLTLLRNVRTSLKPGGVFIMDLVGKECVAASPGKTRWEQSSDGDILIDHAEVVPGWAKLRLHWLLVKGEQARRFSFDLNLYSGVELCAALERAGFSDIQIFGSLAGAPYDAKSLRLVARAVAPG